MTGKTMIVGLAGGTCSGKSTLVAELKKRLEDTYQVHSIMMDMFWQKPGPDVVAPITRTIYKERNHPDALDQERLFAEFDQARLSGDFDVIFIEGLFALHMDRVRDLLDVRIFVDLQSDERMYRRIKRWMKFGEDMESIVNRYLDTVRFRHAELVEPTRWHADVVINGTLELNKGADILECYIRQKLTAADIPSK